MINFSARALQLPIEPNIICPLCYNNNTDERNEQNIVIIFIIMRNAHCQFSRVSTRAAAQDSVFKHIQFPDL